jgi:predicted acylesterase/phospholipase RssA/CRP-like cAMP-binding protein
MTRADPGAVLRAAPLFATLGEAALEAIGADAVPLALPAGETLVRTGDVGNEMFVVAEGRLRVELAIDQGTTTVCQLGPGDVIGEMAVLFGGVRLATVVAETDAVVLRLHAASVIALGEAMLGRIALLAERRLAENQVAIAVARLVGGPDPALVEEFMRRGRLVQLARGEFPFRMGAPAESFFIIVQGRLEIVSVDAHGVEHTIGQAAAGEAMGELALLTGQPRMATPYALRPTVLLEIGRSDFETLALGHPRMLRSILQQVARRAGGPTAARVGATTNIAVLPAAAGPIAGELTRALAAALAEIGPTLLLDFEKAVQLGVVPRTARQEPEHPAWRWFEAWLHEMEARHAFVLLEPDGTASAWSERAVAAADHVVVAADVTAAAEPGDVERRLLSREERGASIHLVLVHPLGTRIPDGTARWLRGRKLHRHHHVRRGARADVERIARTLAGRALGLVLGGGGARGYAHVGVLKALAQLGIPVDLVGGTSMGAVIAAGHALGHDAEAIFELNRVFVEKRPFSQYTLPLVSLLDPRALEECLDVWCAGTRIEDLWLPYFCNSSDLIDATHVVHEHGPLGEALRASTALPGILSPQRDGARLLVDGGVINVLPTDVMRERTRGPLLAVNVSTRQAGFRASAYVPSPWELVLRRVIPGRGMDPAPSIIELLMRSTWLGNDHRMEAQAQLADLCLAPPVERFGLVAFDAAREIADIGHAHALERLPAWWQRARAP